MPKELTPWEKAQHLRRLAVLAKTRKAAQALYIKARYLEQISGKLEITSSNSTTAGELYTTPLRRDGEQVTSSLPRWFREAHRAIRCVKCGDKRGVWWYQRVTDSKSTEKEDYKRVRILARIRRGAFDSAKELMKLSITLCRGCVK